jgi:hypothetical protein
MALIECQECNSLVSSSFEKCPKCNAILKDSKSKINNVLNFAILLFVIFLTLWAFGTCFSTKSINSDCWNLGYKFGYCGTISLHGLTCAPEDDVAIPSECRGKKETQMGISRGTEAAYEKLGLPKK